jgi:hypothetical protein
LKLGIGGQGLGWMYRTYGVTIDEAPEAPGAATVTQKPAGRLDVAWPASTTTTNLAGYDLYRSAAGGAYTKLSSLPLTGLTYSDTATVDGTSYTYKVQAVSAGSPVLTSLFGGSGTAVADATPPAPPTGVSLANGGLARPGRGEADVVQRRFERHPHGIADLRHLDLRRDRPFLVRGRDRLRQRHVHGCCRQRLERECGEFRLRHDRPCGALGCLHGQEQRPGRDLGLR